MLKLAKTHISLNFFHSSISKNCSLVTCLYSSIVKFSTWSSISSLFNSKVSGFLVQWSIICWSVKISDVGSSLSRAICSSAVFVKSKVDLYFSKLFIISYTYL